MAATEMRGGAGLNRGPRAGGLEAEAVNKRLSQTHGRLSSNLQGVHRDVGPLFLSHTRSDEQCFGCSSKARRLVVIELRQGLM